MRAIAKHIAEALRGKWVERTVKLPDWYNVTKHLVWKKEGPESHARRDLSGPNAQESIYVIKSKEARESAHIATASPLPAEECGARA